MTDLDPMLSNEVEKIAAEYQDRSPAELSDLFQEEWWMATPRDESSTQRSPQFWERFKERLIAEILKNRDAGSVTLGFMTSQVLGEVQRLGVDLTAYKIPIAILVALIARSVWDAIEKK